MCACTWTPQCQTHLISPLLDFLWTRFRATHLTFHTQRKLVKTGLLLVSLRGSNGSTVLVALNANKFVMKREIFRIGQKKDFEEVHAPLKNVVPRVDPSDLAIGGWDCSSTNLADLLHRVDRYTCRTPHFSCTVIAQPDHQCAYSHLTRHARLKIGVHLCVPHKTPYSLRAMSYTVAISNTHPNICTSFRSRAFSNIHPNKCTSVWSDSFSNILHQSRRPATETHLKHIFLVIRNGDFVGGATVGWFVRYIARWVANYAMDVSVELVHLCADQDRVLVLVRSNMNAPMSHRRSWVCW